MEATAIERTNIGVDIGPDYIRVVEIERAGQEYILRSIGMKKTPEDAVEDGFIRNPRAVGRIIREIFHNCDIRERHVVTAVRGSGVVSRLLTLPAMAHERIRKLIETEIKRYVRFTEEDKVVYYHPLEEFDEGGRQKISVLLVVARKDLCKSYYDTFRAAGLELAAIDVGCFSALRVLRNSLTAFPPGSLMSVIFDYDGVAVNILHADSIRFFRNIRLPHSEKAPCTNGFMEKVLPELLLTVHYYQEEYARREDIKKMVLSMSLGSDTDAPVRIAETFANIPVQMHAPFTNIRVDPKLFSVKEIEKVDMGFLSAVGLSLRGQEVQALPFEVDLMPTEIGEMKSLLRAAKIFAGCLILLILGFMAHYGFLWYQGSLLDKQMADIARRTREADIWISAENKKLLNTVGGAPETPAGPRTASWAAVLDDVKTLIPKTVQLLSLTLDEAAGVEMVAVADDNSGIYLFQQALGRSRTLINARLGPRDNIQLNGAAGVKFTILCNYKP